MARNPINRAITNVASDMRRRGGFYIPTDYLQRINKQNIINAYKSGVKLQTAVRRELSRVAVKNPTVTLATGEVIEGKKAAVLIADVNEWNRKWGQMNKKGVFAKSITPIDISKIRNPDLVLAQIHGKSPVEVLRERDQRARDNLNRSMNNANLPDAIKDAINEKISQLSPSDLNRILYSIPELEELYGSNTQTMKLHIDEYLNALGIKKTEIDSSGNETLTAVGEALGKWVARRTY